MDLKKHNLKKAINAYVTAFEVKHETVIDGFIADDIIGIALFADSYFNMSDIIFDLDNSCPKDFIWDWYNQTLDRAMEEKQTINYKAWTMGLRYEDL